MVGNHSSGKSSFINYVLGRQIQTAGVAPTDDAFTIIAPGPADRDQDGPALSMFKHVVVMSCRDAVVLTTALVVLTCPIF